MTERPANFISNIIDEDLKTGKHASIVTRFPPEPNGYLHVGHAKSICVNFGFAEDYPGSRCHLRFDDTNPLKESTEYMNSIKQDIAWLGFDWGDHLHHASDYFDKLFELAIKLIEDGKAYVCSLSPEQVREYRGTLTEAGRNSPDRDRSIKDNLDLFRRMRAGEFEDGAYTLRAKIDMSSGNINLRDPALYRIRHFEHIKTGSSWPIYPMYDYTHCVSDAIEEITHSLCTLEFEDHRPLYDWILDQLPELAHPRQIEFARLEFNYTVTSKRYLKKLVEDGHVSGWDDPRMPTIRAMRRRGYTPRGIRSFCDGGGVSKKKTTIDLTILEDSIRDDLNKCAPRAFGVLDPLKVVITSYEDGKIESIDAAAHPKDDTMGRRKIHFTREIYIERSDFEEEPPKGFFRLAPGKEVRLRFGYIIKCEEVIKDAEGKITELRCVHDPDTLGKKPADGRKVKGIIHWVSASEGIRARVNLYDRLFNTPFPLAKEKEGGSFLDSLNPNSLIEIENAIVEPGLKGSKPESHFQFERLGYFTVDSDSTDEMLVFNRTTTLRDTWAKMQSEQSEKN